MSIIKEAFVEGRTTDVDWKDSEAKKNALRLDVFAHNADNFNGREFRKKIALEQVDPETGKVVQSFSSRLEAAKWIVKNVLNVDNDPKDRRAVSITGNMHMCMLSGFKAYGSYWRHIDDKKHEESIVSKAKKTGGKLIWVMGSHGRTNLYPSMEAAAKGIRVREQTLREALRASAFSRVKGYLISEYNPTETVIEFNNATDAANYFNVNSNTVVSAFDENRTINNIKLIINNRNAANVKMYQVIGHRGKIVEEFTSKRQIEAKYKVKNADLTSAIANRTPFSGMLRCVQVTKSITKIKLDKRN